MITVSPFTSTDCSGSDRDDRAQYALTGMDMRIHAVVALRSLPNLISLGRLLLVPPAGWLILQHEDGWALAVFFIAGASDAVDGFLARRFGWQTRLGGFLDPLADKLLIVVCVGMLALGGTLPLWLLLAVVVRDAVIAVGAGAYHLFLGPFTASPSLLSKLNTLCQIAVVLSALVARAGAALPEAVVSGLVWTTLLTTVSSGIGYVWIWGRRACVSFSTRNPG